MPKRTSISLSDLPWSDIRPQLITQLVVVLLAAATLGEALSMAAFMLAVGAFFVFSGFALAKLIELRKRNERDGALERLLPGRTERP